MRIILFSLIISFSFIGNADDLLTGFWCDYDFDQTDQYIPITPNTKMNDCVADLVWGSDNACFAGDAEIIVNDINKGLYDWSASYGIRMEKAKYDKKRQSIIFTGIDFLMKGEVDIQVCNSDILENLIPQN